MEPNYEQIAKQAGFTLDEESSVVPTNPEQEGFWEDWQTCCEANGLVPLS